MVSHPTKPRLVVDVDGVLCDFMSYALAEINGKLGTIYRPEDQTSWGLLECFGQTAEDMCREIMRIGTCYEMASPFPEAKECFDQLSHSFDVWLATSITGSHKDARSKWLSAHGFVVPHTRLLCLEGSDKISLCLSLNAVGIVEDKQTTIHEAYAVGVPAYMVAHPYNSLPVPVPGVFRGSLKEITECLTR